MNATKPTRIRETYAEHLEIERETLSDDSVTTNLVYTLENDGVSDGVIRFACTDQDHARRLADELQKTAWIEHAAV